MIKVLTIILGLAIAVILGLSLFLAPNDLAGCGDGPSDVSKCQKADAIVSVSGGDTLGRAQKATQLYQQGYAPLLIFSGAAKDPNSPSNAKVMEGLAESQGVPASAIKIDEQSRNTVENAAGVKKYLTGDKKVILVTSQYHQRRAHKDLHQAMPNLEIIDEPAKDQNWNQWTWWLTPYGWWITGSEVVKNIF